MELVNSSSRTATFLKMLTEEIKAKEICLLKIFKNVKLSVTYITTNANPFLRKGLYID